MQWDLQRPEIEARAYVGDDFKLQWQLPEVPTCIDVLDLYEPTQGSRCRAVYKEKLGHDPLIQHLQAKDKPELRILFIPADPTSSDSVDPAPALSFSTAAYLISQHHVSSVYISGMTIDPWVLKTGNGHFHTKDDKGNTTVCGLYRTSFGFQGSVLSSNVWFSHRFGNQRSSFYIIRNCSSAVRDNILRIARSEMAQTLFRPMTVDGFMADGACSAWSEEFLDSRDKLIGYEHKDTEELRPHLNEAIKDLHVLAQELHILREDLRELIDRLDYLQRVHKSISSRSSRRKRDANSTLESINYLASRAAMWERWTENYVNRVGIRINLIFNLASQWDNQTNLHVAEFTSKIATLTGKDSSAMITLSAVTMIFLPGTFVSVRVHSWSTPIRRNALLILVHLLLAIQAIFSMVFFDTAADASTGKLKLIVASQWWLFPTITIPLTLLVFFVWNTWRRRNNLARFSPIRNPLASQVAPEPTIPLSERTSTIDLAESGLQDRRSTTSYQTSLQRNPTIENRKLQMEMAQNPYGVSVSRY